MRRWGLPDCEGTFARLVAAHGEPRRHYHNATHVADCLERLDEFGGGPRPQAELALWFHDAVHDPTASGNEGRSAAWATAFLADNGIGEATAAAIDALVRVTDHVREPVGADQRLVCDIDLSILGRAADEYDRYAAAIRAEYAHVPDDAYRLGRAAVLRRFLQRRPLYRVPTVRRRFEQPARTNLRRELDRL